MILAAFAYYVLVIPISLLPLPILYLFTDFFYLLIITIVPYRSKVIDGNLERSFPNLSKKERDKIKRKYYRHFTNLLAEGIKNLTISKASLQRRFKVRNPEIMEELAKKNRNVLLVSGHYNNWEWLITSQAFLFPFEAYGIGMPLSSKFWDKKVNERRSRFGMNVIHAGNYREALAQPTDLPKSVLVLSDQSPGDARKSYWTDFLNQQTAVLFGAEMMANELDYAVVFFTTHRIKRGYYEMELEIITEDAKSLSWGEITEKHVHLLEKQILDKPQFWLWSHKRWKREVPQDLDQLKRSQIEKFTKRYRS
ncbi:MAG: lysophospholipid acyltransferase family protein [Flavobacteriales bacterium]|nr:lysophospholipid acyltransferase family protein [Flavobacteriales bacterium]